MPNRLAGETSPYLQQHAENPVDWYPWGVEAFAAARERDVPVFLSIGYSTCHWCHVMAHESFEDPDTARQLNEGFVAVKVDREERPDVDAIHMAAAQAMGIRGGWPLSVFLTPEGRPFFAGTYWPAAEHPHMPSFRRVLSAIAHGWETQRRALIDDADRLVEAMTEAARTPPSDASSPDGVPDSALARAVVVAGRLADRRWGGFDGAPKFPMPPVLLFLLRHHARTGAPDALAMVERTLAGMADGGIHDHLGGGFARYSTDARWHVPHFEKMLDDNAQLLELYADLALVTANARYGDVARGIVTWLERDMLLDGGAFAAALDADSEGVEGKFYLWTAAEIRQALGNEEDAALAIKHFGVTDPGTVEGANVLRVSVPAAELDAGPDPAGRLADIRERLRRAREDRVHPGRDRKVVAAWNGLAIHALARAGRALAEPAWVERARAAADFVLRELRTPDGGIARTWNDGRTTAEGVLEDYAALARGLVTLHMTTGEGRWLEEAAALVEVARTRFVHETVGYHDTSAVLFVRQRDLTDGVSPSGNALMAEVLALLASHRWDEELRAEAGRIVAATRASENPLGGGFALAVAERLATPARELVLVGDPASDAVAELRDVALRRFGPGVVVGYASSGDWPMTADRPPVPGAPAAAYVCENHACLAPVTTAADLAALLG